jgi:hypothetical protein
MKGVRIALAVAALVLFAVPHAARAGATCLSIVVSTAPVALGSTLTFTASCCVPVPALANHGWLLAGALLVAGALAVRRNRRIVAGLLVWALLGSFPLPARAQSCGQPFQWKAQSASETFLGTAATFSFTPAQSGTFTVSLSDACETAAPATVQVLVPAVCGDGVVGIGEQCDPPSAPICNGACCSGSCQIVQVDNFDTCGNGKVVFPLPARRPPADRVSGVRTKALRHLPRQPGVQEHHEPRRRRQQPIRLRRGGELPVHVRQRRDGSRRGMRAAAAGLLRFLL